MELHLNHFHEVIEVLGIELCGLIIEEDIEATSYLKEAVSLGDDQRVRPDFWLAHFKLLLGSDNG